MAIFSKPDKFELHIHFHGMDAISEKLAVVETNLKGYIMATKDEVLAAIADEGNEVAVKIAELHGMIVDTAAIAAGIRQPILWLTAAQAPQAFIAKHIRKVGFAQVFGAHHFPHFEQPAQTNAAIEAFLARLKRA